MTDGSPHGAREGEPTAVPPRAAPSKSWVANVGQWLFAYTVAWSLVCVLATLTLAVTPQGGLVGDGVALVFAWVIASALAVDSSHEPTERGTSLRRRGVAVLMSLPGLLIAVLAGMTVFLLPVLLILGVFGSPVLPWFHRGSPVWERLLLSLLGIAATVAIAWTGVSQGASSWTEPWVLVVVLGPFLAAGSATGALFALRTVGVPPEVG